MKIYDKFIKKYGNKEKEVLLPPPPEETVEELEVLPPAPRVPVIPDPTEEEMNKFHNWRYDPEEAQRIRKHLERLQESKEKGEKETFRPGKMGNPTRVASPESPADVILKACNAYYRLTTKTK